MISLGASVLRPNRAEAILGIDAAWTEKQPSGVALVVCDTNRWSVSAVAPSYHAFVELSHGTSVQWDTRHKGSFPDPTLLIESVDRLLPGVRLSVVAVDMPMATVPIRGRRNADNEVSRNYWKQKCGTHSPNKDRPGKVGTALANGFIHHGFRLDTIAGLAGSFAKSLIEVYPHPALVALTGAEERLRYKLSKACKYWPNLSSVLRREWVMAELNRIETRLKIEFDGLTLPPLQPDSPTFVIKAREDSLDALVSAWVGMQYRRGLASAFGDETAAIWIPVIPQRP